MNFATAQFGVFFLLVFAAYWHLRHRNQRLLLLLASWFFYACWDYRFLTLIWISTVVDFIAGRKIFSETRLRQRRAWLVFSLVANLGILGYFKYCNFFVDSLVALVNALGLDLPQVVLEITLPVGISFYTFQTLTYSLDIYGKRLEPTSSFLDFALFVAFFPQLVAGPIVRARDFLPQMQSRRRFQMSHFETGLRRFFYGYIKKAFIGDTLALVLVDPVFANPGAHDTTALWLAIIGYTVQIYCDFSGYSSMAIGTAKMLGFEITENFCFPYLAWNFSDFWRRWHITMSGFFRDYIYIPLGGNRVSYTRNLLNLAATTLVSGLWHGASWTFVVWGGLHGLYIATSHILTGRTWVKSGGLGVVLVGWVLTQALVMLAWILFRAADFGSAWVFLNGLWGSAGTQTVAATPLVWAALALFVGDHVFGWTAEHRPRALERIPTAVDVVAHVALVVFLFHAVPQGETPFIYFQF